MTEPDTDFPVTTTWVVSAETWDWLQAELARPPRANPKMVELLRQTRGRIRHER